MSIDYGYIFSQIDKAKKKRKVYILFKSKNIIFLYQKKKYFLKKLY